MKIQSVLAVAILSLLLTSSVSARPARPAGSSSSVDEATHYLRLRCYCTFKYGKESAEADPENFFSDSFFLQVKELNDREKCELKEQLENPVTNRNLCQGYLQMCIKALDVAGTSYLLDVWKRLGGNCIPADEQEWYCNVTPGIFPLPGSECGRAEQTSSDASAPQFAPTATPSSAGECPRCINEEYAGADDSFEHADGSSSSMVCSAGSSSSVPWED